MPTGSNLWRLITHMCPPANVCPRTHHPAAAGTRSKFNPMQQKSKKKPKLKKERSKKRVTTPLAETTKRTRNYTSSMS